MQRTGDGIIKHKIVDDTMVVEKRELSLLDMLLIDEIMELK